MRKFVCAAVATVCVVSVAMSGEYIGRITKLDGDKVTFVKGGKKGQKGEEMTFTLAKDAKILKGKFGKGDDGKFKVEAGDAIEGGAASVTKMLDKAGEKGVFAQVVTDDTDKTIKEVRILGGRKKKKKTDN